MLEEFYAPEGALLDTEENRARTASPAALARAQLRGEVAEGVAVRCHDDRSLSVQFNGFTGIIPREEGAMGIREGKTRDVAILSRVGKPVCAVVTGFDGETPLLSRRLAQESSLIRLLQDLRPGRVLPARVTHLERFGAFLDLGRGVTSFLGLEAISVSRIAHAADRFAPGQDIFVAVKAVERGEKRIYLTHRELLGTWAENAAAFPAGTAVRGVVRTVEPYGVFVELAPNLSGLAEPRPELRPGTAVSVFIKSVQPGRMKIKLSVLDVLGEQGPQPLRRGDYYITGGTLTHWRYSPPECESKVIETWF